MIIHCGRRWVSSLLFFLAERRGEEEGQDLLRDTQAQSPVQVVEPAAQGQGLDLVGWEERVAELQEPARQVQVRRAEQLVRVLHLLVRLVPWDVREEKRKRRRE